jgi:hypothetical protein
MEFYSADIEMLMSGWNTLQFAENGINDDGRYPDHGSW